MAEHKIQLPLRNSKFQEALSAVLPRTNNLQVEKKYNFQKKLHRERRTREEEDPQFAG
jgi:hypothetical protein